jgi:hypothetical protein
VAAEHEVDASPHRLAQDLDAPRAGGGRARAGDGVGAIVQREDDVPGARAAQGARVARDQPGRVGIDVRAGMQRRHPGDGGPEHADRDAARAQQPGRRQPQPQVGGQQRERELAAPAPHVRRAPVELVVPGHGDVDGQVAQREERPHAVAERAERAALREVAGVDPQPPPASARRSSTVACSAAAPGSRP